VVRSDFLHRLSVRDSNRIQEPAEQSDADLERVGRAFSGARAPAEATKDWVLIDAEGIALSRLAVIIANRLRGKHRSRLVPYGDSENYVVVINADKARNIGNKAGQSAFHFHSGYADGIKGRSKIQRPGSKSSGYVLERAVERMISRGPMQRKQMKYLHIYGGTAHPHHDKPIKKLNLDTGLKELPKRFEGPIRENVTSFGPAHGSEHPAQTAAARSFGERLQSAFSNAVSAAVDRAHANGLAVPGRVHGVPVQYKPDGRIEPIEGGADWLPVAWKG